ncbi:MAG: hypothetical protein D4R68_08230 [Ignavibacteriales bacterium]|nr:MAG: hypothetical protein D4R68_08230 [Ignavibacteriales bacterium]
MSTNSNLNQESTAAENLLYQRLIIFLIVFSVFVLGAVSSQRKILFLSILSLGVIICWVLTFIIIRTAKRIDKKSGGRLIRLLLGYLVPIFCSLLLTLALTVGSFGFVDPYLFNVDLKPVQIEKKVNEITNEIKNQLKPKVDTTYNNFKNIDSVIAGNKAGTKKKLISNEGKDSKHFKSIESIIKEKKK